MSSRKLLVAKRACWLAGLLIALPVPHGCTLGTPPRELSFVLAIKTDPIVGDAMPTVPTGPEWISDIFETRVGNQVPIVRKQTPEVSLSLETVRKVQVFQSPWDLALFPKSNTVGAILIVGSDEKKQFREMASEYPGYWVLVVADGLSIDLAPIGGGTANAVPGGSFRSEEHARKFYSSIQDRLSVERARSEDVESWRAFNDATRLDVLWGLECDPEFRSSLARDGFDPAELLETLRGPLDQIDCSVEPPDIPEVP